MADTDLTNAISQNAASAQSVSTRDGAVTSQPLAAQIEADKYLAGKQAASAGRCGVRFFPLTGNGMT